jgi:Rifampin ADP-ribosyl transferase
MEKRTMEKSIAAPSLFAQTLLHGTKADFKIGDFIEVGAELALGEGSERIYLVEPTGPIEDDPNLTDKKYPGNPTKSYRSKDRFKVVGEVAIWQGHSPEQVKAMKDGLAKLKEQGIEAIED